MRQIPVVIHDIETLKEQFLVSIYVPDSNEWFEFGINKWENSIDRFIKFTEQYNNHYWVGYNCLSFDGQVLEYIIRNYEFWYDLDNLKIVELIYNKAQETIENSNYGLFPEYREENLSIKYIDLFTIWHFNNKNRRVSLKALECAMDMENVEEMPIHHSKENLTQEETEQIKSYCRNDIETTYKFYLITRGQTDHKLYKGEDKIEDRFAMEEEFGLKCLNWDDVKIGAEWNKLDYIKLSKKNERDLKPTRIIHFYGKKFKQFFPSWVKFQTPELQKFVRDFGNTHVLNSKQEFKYKFNKELKATIAKGGIHSNEKGRFLQPDDNEIYYQVDIGSQYPNGIRKYKVEPRHLPGWNSLIVSKIDRRLKYKKEYNETKIPKFNSLQKMGKLALNGGSYGRLNTQGDWQEYPYGMLQVTIGGQLEILMITEDLLLKGFRVISLNTDGFDCIIPKEREEEFKKVLTDWEKVISNDVLGNFEYTPFKWIAQTSVNDYLALKYDGKTKEKGDFEIDKEINKNKSARIVPIALREYFVNGTPIEKTIKSHNNPYDFCIIKKATRDFHYEGISKEGNNIYNKLIRYIVCNKGEKILKIKNPECKTNAPDVAQAEAGSWLCRIYNFLPKDTIPQQIGINYNYYIEKTQNIIDKIALEGRKTVKKQPENQLKLF